MHADSATDVIIVVVMMIDCLRFPLNSSNDCLQAGGQHDGCQYLNNLKNFSNILWVKNIVQKGRHLYIQNIHVQ